MREVGPSFVGVRVIAKIALAKSEKLYVSKMRFETRLRVKQNYQCWGGMRQEMRQICRTLFQPAEGHLILVSSKALMRRTLFPLSCRCRLRSGHVICLEINRCSPFAPRTVTRNARPVKHAEKGTGPLNPRQTKAVLGLAGHLSIPEHD